MTALHFAAFYNDKSVVEELLSAGAVQLLNNESNAPVDIAAICEHWETVEIFASYLTKQIA